MKTRFLWVAFVAVVMAASPLYADVQGTVAAAGGDPPMPLDGSWVILDEYMTAPAFFSGPYTWTSSVPVTFTVTDLFVVSDQFEVYDNGVLVMTTPAVPDWPAYASDPFTSPPYTTDPDVALASGYFSSGVISFGPGSHSITIRDFHIPPVGVGGGPFFDGTVAFKAVPLPASLLLGVAGMGLIGWLKRRMK